MEAAFSMRISVISYQSRNRKEMIFSKILAKKMDDFDQVYFNFKNFLAEIRAVSE